MPEAFAAAAAFSAAFSAKLAPVSSGSGRPSFAAETTSMPNGANSSAISHFALVVAGDDEPRRRRMSVSAISGDGELLQRHKLGDAAPRERHELVELLLAERLGLGGALHLDDAA